MKTGLKKALLASAGVALVAGAVAAPAMAADKGSDHGKKPAGISQKAPGKGDAKPGKGSKPSMPGKGVKDAGPLQAAGMTPAQVEAVAQALRDHGDHAFADAQKTALAALVAAGTITQAQADEIAANLAKAGSGHGNAHGPVMDKGPQDATADAGRPMAGKPGMEDGKPEGLKSEKPEGPRGEHGQGEHGRGDRPVPATSPAA